MGCISLREERQFGLVIGGACLLIGTWLGVRGTSPVGSRVALGSGAALVLLGLVVPRVLVFPRRGWTTLAEVIGFVTTRLILAIIFFLIVTPVGFAKRLFGWDPLRRRAGSRATYWFPYSERQRDPRHYDKMY